MEQQTLEQRVKWYVLRVTYQREMIAKRRLDELSIESFVPTKVVRVTLQNGRRALQRRALVHNYIFIHATRATIDQIKSLEPEPFTSVIILRHEPEHQRFLMFKISFL